MPPRSIHTFRLPGEVDVQSLRDTTVVVIDVLRATSTITTALRNGAGRVIPCDSIESAILTHRELAGDCLLCGERQGAKIDGFDCGNSPEEFPSSSVLGKTLVFTTTNGTRAMLHARQADKVLLGCFLNFSTLSSLLATTANDVRILCSGTNRVATLEDELLAGAIVSQFDPDQTDCDATSLDVAQKWRSILTADGRPRDLYESLKLGQGGINLVKRGLEQDIKYCSQVDLLDTVCEFDPNLNVIRVSNHQDNARPMGDGSATAT